jgi:hypothetical protein
VNTAILAIPVSSADAPATPTRAHATPCHITTSRKRTLQPVQEDPRASPASPRRECAALKASE